MVTVCDCRGSGSRSEPLGPSISSLSKRISGGQPVTATRLCRVTKTERSYCEEMAALEILRTASAENPVIIAIEEAGESNLSTIDMLCFLARNIGGLRASIIASHRSLDLDQSLSERLEIIGDETLVHKFLVRPGDGKETGYGCLIDHEPFHRHFEQETPDQLSAILARIAVNINSSQEALASGDPALSASESGQALEDAKLIGHHGLEIDSLIAMGVALTQAGWEKQALHTLDQAVDLAGTLGEFRSQYIASIRRSELLLFSVGEPDSAYAEAAIAEEISSQMLEEDFKIEPLTLKAIVESVNGRRERAEKAFCEATTLLVKQPVEARVLERTLLALAAATLLEARHDLNGMNQRYLEAEVLASGTAHPVYWEAIVSLQRGRSLLRLKRPQEAKGYLELAAKRFNSLGNTVQSTRAMNAVEESEEGIMLY